MNKKILNQMYFNLMKYKSDLVIFYLNKGLRLEERQEVKNNLNEVIKLLFILYRERKW